MNVAVTGAAGFLGRRLTALLEEERGWAPLPLTRSEADVTDLDALRRCCRDAAIDALVHLAFPVADRDRTGTLGPFRDAAVGTANVLALAGERGVAHVVLASSGKVYGWPRVLPIPETHPLAPTTGLGHLKRLQEALMTTAGRGGAPFATTMLRLFNVYGPGQRAGFLVPHLLRGLREEGERLRLGELAHRRDWIHLDDACRAVLAALAAPPDRGEPRALNVGSGDSTSIRELVGHFEDASGRALVIETEPGRTRPDEPPEERADTSRLRALGWRARVDLAAGIRRLWDETSAPRTKP